MRAAFAARVLRLAHACAYKPGWRLIVKRDQSYLGGARLYVQVEAEVVDVDSGQRTRLKGGKAYLSEHMTDTEIVRTIFGRFLAFETHECMEAFTFNGARIFGPHIDVYELAGISHYLDTREAVA